MLKEQLGPDKYFNTHTHIKTSIEDEVSVYVLSQEDLLNGNVNLPYSCAGIHPWWADEISKDEIEKLQASVKSLLDAGKIWAVGETGLDRLYPEYLDYQKELFSWHIELSEKYQKPLIIHNVRTGSDILELIKAHKPSTSWLFHDFRGNIELVNSLLKLHDKCFFSFGISLDNSQSSRELIRELPIDKVLLETDAQKHLDIHDVYIRACKELKLDLADLKNQMYNNFLALGPRIH